MAKRLSVMALAAGMAAAGVAIAQAAQLSAAEARAELFGVELIGVEEETGAPWRECIEPSGRTFYEFAGEADEGRLRIDAEGRACFRYLSSGFADETCWAVQREGKNYRFGSFITNAVRAGVTQCGYDLRQTV